MGYPAFVKARTHKFVKRTAGNITLDQTAITEVTSDLRIELPAQAGDTVFYCLAGLLSATAQDVGFDYYTVVSGTRTNPFGAGLSASLGSTIGIPAAYCPAVAQSDTISVVTPYTVVSGDLVSGKITVGVYYAKSTGTARTLLSDTNNPLIAFAWVHGPQDET